MAIVEMQKLKLLGFNIQKDKILDDLFRSQEIQLKQVNEIDNTFLDIDQECLSNYENLKSRLKSCIDFLEKLLDEKNVKFEQVLDLDLKDFAEKKRGGIISKTQILKDLEKVEKLRDFQNQIISKINYNKSLIINLSKYKCVKESFDEFKDTKNVFILLGYIPVQNISYAKKVFSEEQLVEFELFDNGVLKICFHLSNFEKINNELKDIGFVKCTFDYSCNAHNKITEINNQIKNLQESLDKSKKDIQNYVNYLRDYKIFYDYLNLLIQKINANNMVRSTNKCFVLEGYLQVSSKEKIENILKNYNVEYEFVKVSKTDNPPIVLKNLKIIKPYEFITNMYSPPNYREIDPNIFLALFFSIFFGFVMADIGYGILLVLFGSLLYFTQKKYNSFKSLVGILSICGIFTIVFGILFGSFFGVSNQMWEVVPKAVLPNPAQDVISMLGICLSFGIIQIMFAFFLRAILLIKEKQILQSIFNGFMWEVFFVGLIFISLDFAGIIYNFQKLGLILLFFSILVIAISNLFINKGLNRLTKSFGSIYSIINIFSDILSYARLFGLMLSGAIISTIVNDLASSFFTSSTLFPIGILIVVIGHSFNLAIGVLGAYIHVSRLQYIEFFSRFYTGEGELFKPFGWSFDYVYLKK